MRKGQLAGGGVEMTDAGQTLMGEIAWPSAKVERMKELAARGLSAAQIGAEIRMSRNAVIGKCARLHVPLISQAAVGGRPKTDLSKKPVKPSLAHLELIKTADEAGEAIPDVMAKTGLSYSQIAKLRQDMGLKKKKTKRQAADDTALHRIKARMNNPVPAEVDMQERFREGYLGQRGSVSLFELSAEHCKFPIDQAEGPPRFCGEPRVGTESWCEHHFQRCTGVQYKQGGHFKLSPMIGSRRKVAA
jgi:hypothetical protein